MLQRPQHDSYRREVQRATRPAHHAGRGHGVLGCLRTGRDIRAAQRGDLANAVAGSFGILVVPGAADARAFVINASTVRASTIVVAVESLITRARADADACTGHERA